MHNMNNFYQKVIQELIGVKIFLTDTIPKYFDQQIPLLYILFIFVESDMIRLVEV